MLCAAGAIISHDPCPAPSSHICIYSPCAQAQLPWKPELEKMLFSFFSVAVLFLYIACRAKGLSVDTGGFAFLAGQRPELQSMPAWLGAVCYKYVFCQDLVAPPLAFSRKGGWRAEGAGKFCFCSSGLSRARFRPLEPKRNRHEALVFARNAVCVNA